MDLFTILARALVVFTSMPIHECAHALAAKWLGDDTADRQGRLTLDPFSHLDLTGTLLILVAGFGWARPVPINPRNFKNPKRDMALSAMAGPVSNLLLALLVLIFYRVLLGFVVFGPLSQYAAAETLLEILWIIYSTNIMLAVFNLLPVPPLDGWKMMGAVLPSGTYWKIMSREREIGMIFMLLILFTPVVDLPISIVGNYISDLFVKITGFVPWIFQMIG